MNRFDLKVAVATVPLLKRGTEPAVLPAVAYPTEFAGVCDLNSLSPQVLDDVLEATALEEIWGIGPRIAKQMRELGLTTCLDVARIDPSTARQRWSVALERTVR